MLKPLLTGAVAALSCGALMRAPDDTPAAPLAPSSFEAQGDVLLAATPDPADDLRSAYVILRQLRGERLEERPKALAERAIVLYRDGVQAYKVGDTAKARVLGAASRELAHALEAARLARGDADDPELPRPPVVRLQGTLKLQADQIEVVELPPVLDGDAEGQAKPGAAPRQVRATVRLSPPKQEIAAENVLILRGRDAESAPIVLSPEGKPQEKREFVIEVAPEQVRERVLTRVVPKVKAGGDVLVARIAQDEAATARAELREAHKLITKARAETKGSDTKIYLDAARDLYNAARREAEAGRNARSLELTRAAVALTRVPALLAEVGGGEKEAKAERRAERKEERAERKEERKERRIELRVVPRVEIEKSDGEPKRRIEVRRLRVGPDGKVEEEVEEGKSDSPPRAEAQERDDAGPPVGVGVALGVEDDRFVVIDLIPDGPAAREGTIQKGDVLIGVKQGDEVVKFAGKELVDVVKLVRGKAGTTVTLVIRHEGSEEDENVELTRAKLEVPEPKEAPKSSRIEIVPVPVPGGASARLRLEAKPSDARRIEVGPLHLKLRPTTDPKAPAEGDDADEENLPPSIDV
jgi:hypothetical protein